MNPTRTTRPCPKVRSAQRRLRQVAMAARLCCGAALWAGLGSTAWAQGAGGTLPPTALPQLRGVVGGAVVVNAPAPGATAARMTIDQSSQRAILDWRSFNIGGQAEVIFQHKQGSAASTLNRIFDASPSVIQGRLSSVGPTVDGKATPGGQVILINQNGILFDRGAQVNTQSLLASTLNLTMSNSQFCGGALATCNSGSPLTSGGLLTSAFAGGYDEAGQTLALRPDGRRPGNIGIGSFGAAGAAAPLIESGNGGAVVMVASRIDHDAGIISSPDGQVVLAAGSKAYLAVNNDASDITLRGLVVEVEAHKEGNGLNLTNLVRNAGEITADRGNITIAALAINQEGRLSAKTAVQRNGSIYLSARSKDSAGGADTAGALRLAAGSTTEVMPDAADTATVPDASDYAPYRGVIRARGGVIENQGTLQAAGGRIGIEATNAAQPDAARVYLGAGSLTSVAGFWSDVDPAKNLATFRVTSNELKNSPDQKTGILLGATVTVDLAAGSNLLALDGYRNAVPRTVAEKAAVGGELSIGSSGALIQRSGATLDASGGGYRYADSRVATSSFRGEDGRIYDIATAPQAQRYVAQLDRYQAIDTRWGQTSSIVNLTLASGVSREAYVEGRAGGTLRLGSGAGLVLDGELQGGVTIGTRQFDRAPTGATLYVGTGLQPLSLDLVDRPPAIVTFNAEGQRVGNVLWRQAGADSLGTGFTAGMALSAAQRDTVLLGADQVFGAAMASALGRVETGFGSVEVNADGRITLPADVALKADIGASLTLRSPAIALAGDIHLPAGALLLAPQLDNGVELLDASLSTRNERIQVASSATLSVAGAWLNQSGTGGQAVGERLPSARVAASGSTRSSLDGGSFTVRLVDENFQTRLAAGAVLDASGGALLDAARRLTGGSGGQLTLANGSLNQTSSDWMQAELRGHSVAGGGSLNFNLQSAVLAAADANGVLPAGTTRLGAGLFGSAGFASITVNAANGIGVDAGAQITLRPDRLVVDSAAALALASGGALRDVATAQLLPAHQRSGASLTLAAGVGALTVGPGAALRTDAGGSLSMSAGAALAVDGLLSAPGGRITLSLRGSDLLDAPALRLGSESQLSVAGVFVATPNDTGLRRGNVLGGGTLTLEARQAGILAETGSRIDVSGIEQVLDQPTVGDSDGLRPQAVAGHAGTLVLRAQREVALNGSLLAAGPGTAAGGSFALELLRPDGQVALPAPQRLVVASGSVDNSAAAVATTSALDAAALQAAGFQKLRLQSEDIVEFQGNGTLAFERGIRIDAPVLRLGELAQTTLRASTVSLGQSLGPRTQQPDAFNRNVWTRDDTRAAATRTPIIGSGLLNIDAGSVDFYGSSTIDGTALTRVASAGDVRFIGREVNFNTGSGTADPALIVQAGALRTGGSLEFNASQLYPATRTQFDVQVQGDTNYLLVQGKGQTPGELYSAGGRLALEAHQIVQAGTVRAPQGQIDLRAGTRLELATGSLTSVAGDVTVLYGGTLDGGVQWRYADGNQTNSLTNPRLLDAVTAAGKALTMSAPEIVVAGGASVDLRGGGNVQAVEFVPGNGGDVDIATAANTWAILPSANLAGIPYDTYVQLAGGRDPGAGFTLANARDGTLYDSLQIGAGSRVPAGEYVLLPTRFATLPGAFLVQVQTGAAYRNLQPGQTAALGNGETVAAAHRSAYGTRVRESQSVGVVVLPGAAVSRYSDYTLSGAQLLAAQAERGGDSLPPAPWDAGRMSLQGASALTLGGSFLTANASQDGRTGLGAEIDITGERIAIVGDATTSAVAGTLQISSADLSALNASVLVGGTRTRQGNETTVTTTAEQVNVANSAATAVALPELLISARQGIRIEAGSVLQASAAQGSTPDITAAGPTLRAEASGALLRLSSAGQASVDRGTASAAAGDLVIAPGAQLQASGALLLDATRSTTSAGDLRVGGVDGRGGALSLSASQVSLGQVDTLTDPVLGGLRLSNEDLAGYTGLGEFSLRAYERIDLVGRAVVGSAALGRLTLDTPLLSAQPVNGQAEATVAAGELQWLNRSPSTALAQGGTGQLTMNATRLVLGAGAKATEGFAQVTLNASAGLDLQGQGDLRAGGPLSIAAGTVRALGGADQRLVAVDQSTADAPRYAALTLGPATAAATSTAAADATTPLGGRLSLQGDTVQVDTTVQARSGRLSLQAEGGTLTLGSSARLDATGQAVNFNGSVAAADGGTVVLKAATGRVALQAGAEIDVSAAPEGGRAGTWQLQAAEVELAGTVRAQGSTGGGVAQMDLGRLDDFSSLNRLLDAGGFTAERQLRLRTGNIVVQAADHVDASRVNLSADTGRIDVSGRVGRMTNEGGARLELHAARGLQLAAGSQLLAAGTGTAARGGEVRVDTREGALDFATGAKIDVRAGEAGLPGAVIFGSTRDASGASNAITLAGEVLRHSITSLAAVGNPAATNSVDPATRPASVDLELTRVYGAAEVPAVIGAAQIAAWAADHAGFAGGLPGSTLMAGLRDETGAAAGTRVTGATEVQAAGALTLDANWNLTQAAWLTGSMPGTLTLRAAGGLRLQQTVGAAQAPLTANAATNNPINAANHAILDGDTWNIRLAAGADLAAADPLATLAAAVDGHLVLANAQAGVRTGTGRIDLAAAGDIRLLNSASAVYTAGRIGAADTETNGNNRWAVDGGGISMSAGGSIVGPAGVPDLWVTEWLRRPRQTESQFERDGYLTDWWSFRPRFQQGVATLAGGSIEVQAGDAVRDLMFALPTAGRTVVAAGARTVQVSGGGDLAMNAGGEVDGTSFLVGRGSARVTAGDAIGRNQAVQGYLMGYSSGAVPEEASLGLVAGAGATLQSVDNPTFMGINQNAGAVGPSFGASSIVTSFFTYAANSEVLVASKSGDTALNGRLVPNASHWRSFSSPLPLIASSLPSAGTTAFPASLSLLALGGDVLGPARQADIVQPNLVKTWPSATASLVALAAGDVRELGVEVSDLAPSALVTPTQNFEAARPDIPSAEFFNTGAKITMESRSATVARVSGRSPVLPAGLVARDADAAGLYFDVQALKGSIVTERSSALVLPARSRVRAGQDILNPYLQLQNLAESDLTEVRAVAGDIVKRSVATTGGIEIAGPGRLLLQAGGDIDLGDSSNSVGGRNVGGLVATGNTRNSLLASSQSARLTVIAGLPADVDLTKMDGTYARVVALNSARVDIASLYEQLRLELETPSGREAVLAAGSVADLVARNAAYTRLLTLDQQAPEALATYQAVLREGSLPLSGEQARDADALLKLLAREDNVAGLRTATSLRDYLQSPTATNTLGGDVLDSATTARYLALSDSFPKLYQGAVVRRVNGAQLIGTAPLVFDQALAQVVTAFVGTPSPGGGDILSFQTSIQTLSGGDIDLWAPTGDIVVGLTTPRADRPVGLLTNQGGAIRSVLGGNFNINQGKVLTAQGGDILLFTAQGSIDAGRGAKTSLSTPPPQRIVILDNAGNVLGVEVVIPASATGSGIQTLSSDPDGLGPAAAVTAGDIQLFAPAGKIDAGEAGIRSGGNILINAQVVLNASDIKAAGGSQGVPQVPSGSLASTLAAAGSNPQAAAGGEEKAAKAAEQAARQAASARQAPKPTILSVEVLGFGDKNCKEDDKECFAK